MTRKLLINDAIGETRMALVDEGPDDYQVQEIRLFRHHETSLVGAIYLGRVRQLSSEFQAAFVELEPGLTGFLPLNLLPKCPGKKPADLTQLMQEGQAIIVQVTRDALGDKSVQLTGRVELISSTIVLHPFREGAFVSSRIKDPDRRAELKEFGNTLEEEGILAGMGITLRTEAKDGTSEELRQTASHLVRHWQKSVAKNTGPPCLLAQNPDTIPHIMRDYATRQVDEILFDRPAALSKAQKWAKDFAPDMLARMQIADNPSSLFDDYAVSDELEQIMAGKVTLPSGAWITIERTEALTAIDVNMGAALGSRDKNRQSLMVNVEAAKEICRQIRLRGLGGLFVIDFINMAGKSENTQLLDVMDAQLLKDPEPIQRGNLSAFGLLEMSRKSRYRSLDQNLLTTQALSPTRSTQVLNILREAEKQAASAPGQPVEINLDQAGRDWLDNHPEIATEFTRRTGSNLSVKTG